MDFSKKITKILGMHSPPKKWPEISGTDPHRPYGGRNFYEAKNFWVIFCQKNDKIAYNSENSGRKGVEKILRPHTFVA